MAFRRELVVPRTSEPIARVRADLLPHRPISHVTITWYLDMVATFVGFGLTQTAHAAYASYEIIHRGTTVASLTSEQHTWFQTLLFGLVPYQSNHGGTAAADLQIVTQIIPLGRRLYDENECLPAGQPGDTEIRLDIPALSASITTRRLLIEAVTLPDARPTRRLHYSALQLASPVVGFTNRQPLDRRGELIALILRSAATQDGVGSAANIERFRLEGDGRDIITDNAEYWPLWAESQWRTAIAHADSQIATENLAAAYTQNAQTGRIRPPPNTTDVFSNRYAILDLDPNKDGQHVIDTRRFSTLDLIVDAGTTDDIFIIPIYSEPL